MWELGIFNNVQKFQVCGNIVSAQISQKKNDRLKSVDFGTLIYERTLMSHNLLSHKGAQEAPKTTILHILGSFYPRHMIIFEPEPIRVIVWLRIYCILVPLFYCEYTVY